ncbi:hypothetical protein AAHB37_15215 [Glutamicibacter halophytocola]|uniref:hypothetical protein n=1 Tax=Glutamicibacter halophytocola TaxID=1933880 RepID=UPI00321B2908
MADGAWKVSEIEADEADCPGGTLQPVSTRIAAKSGRKDFPWQWGDSFVQEGMQVMAQTYWWGSQFKKLEPSSKYGFYSL